jgi:type I restriction enzyme M protein
VPLTPEHRAWYLAHITAADPGGAVVAVQPDAARLRYSEAIRSDEDRLRAVTDEELVRALTLCLLASPQYGYPVDSFYIERRYTIGHPSRSGAEVDLIIYDADALPFAMWEMKSPDAYDAAEEQSIRNQLFNTAPQLGEPRLLVYSTIPVSEPPDILCKTIDYSHFKSFDTWDSAGRPYT